MSAARWRAAAAITILALMAISLARAADAPAAPDTAPTPAPAPALPTTPPPSAAPSGPVPVGRPGAATDATEPESSGVDLLAPLRRFGVESWWDVFQMQPWTGTLGFTFDDQEQRIRAPGSPTQTFSNRLLTESATISNDNFAIVNPLLFTGSLMVGVSFQQGWQESLGLSQHETATLDTYAFDGNFLPQSPYNVNLFAVKTQTTYVQPSGSATHSNIQNQGINFQLRETSILRDMEILPYFSANLRVLQQYEKQTTTYGGQSFVQNDRRDQVAARLPERRRDIGPHLPVSVHEARQLRVHRRVVQLPERQFLLQSRLWADAQLPLGFAHQLLLANRGGPAFRPQHARHQ